MPQYTRQMLCYAALCELTLCDSKGCHFLLLRFLQAADPEVSSKTPAGAELFRQAAEAALTAAGLHLAEGHHLWQAYRSAPTYRPLSSACTLTSATVKQPKPCPAVAAVRLDPFRVPRLAAGECGVHSALLLWMMIAAMPRNQC